MWYTIRHMAIESALPRRNFLGLDKLDNYMQSRRSKHRPQPQSRKNQQSPTQGGGGGWHPGRRDFLVAGAVVVGGLILRPWEWLKSKSSDGIGSTIQAVATPDKKENQVLVDPVTKNAEEEVFDLTNYPRSLRQKMVNFWRNGQTQAIQYNKANGDLFLLSFQPAKPQAQMDDLAMTTVNFYRTDLSDGRSSLAISLQGNYLQGLGSNMTPNTQKKLIDMNFEHEALVSIALINAMTNIAKSLGLDFTPGAPKKPNEEDLLRKLQSYVPAANTMAEAVAEINDYLITDPLIERDPISRQPIWASINARPNYMPSIERNIFLEGGLHYIIDSTIGPFIKGVSDFEDLSSNYPRLDKISNFDVYYDQIKNHFQNL